MAPRNLEPRVTLAQSLVVGLPGPTLSPADRALVAEHGVGGIILFARNIAEKDPHQIWELNRELQSIAAGAGKPPLLIMVDQEGGSVARLRGPFTHQPDLCQLGEAAPRALAEHGARLAAELLAAGFNWDLAPVMDVHSLPDGIMAKRSLSGNPQRVAELGAAFIQGMQQAGCLACAKHFPGLGRTTLDTHRDLPRVDLSLDQLTQLELIPFKAAASARVAGIMVCHAVFSQIDPDSPASLSPKVIGGLLRGELAYEGLVLSDDLEMGAVTNHLPVSEAVVQAYLAGCDLVLVCHRPELALQALDTLVAMVERGELSKERVARTGQAIARIKAGLPAGPPEYSHLADLLGIATA
jgi:beta-N-acetylhexosaminidase